jgi:hypothetical protein
VLYIARDDWPEQDCLVAWLERNARCREIGEAALIGGELPATLDALSRQPAPMPPAPAGAAQAAAFVLARLEAGKL